MPYMPEKESKIKKPEYADRVCDNQKIAHENYCNILKPVAKDTNKTRRERIKPTSGSIIKQGYK